MCGFGNSSPLVYTPNVSCYRFIIRRLAAMRSLPFFPIWLWFFVVSASALPQVAGGVEPKVQILSPKEGSRLAQEENTILVSGKVGSPTARSENVDIMLVIDISGSTALYAGAD